MTSRREFLGWSVAAAALPSIAMGSAGHTASLQVGARPTHLYKAICDQRHSAARQFARALEGHGVPIRAVGGDITDLWVDDLSVRWRAAPAAIAGLTPPETLLCLEQLAWGHRMRAVFQAEHRPLPGAGLEHRLRGPESLLQLLDGPAAGHGWVNAMAELAARCPRGQDAAQQTTAHRSWIEPARTAQLARPLVSWVIAPV
jgi:hypothetical protein